MLTMHRRATFVTTCRSRALLVKFYQEFQARQKEDATGFASLQTVLSETDMDAFKTKWEKYRDGLATGLLSHCPMSVSVVVARV